jgi:hypothetical protein
VFLRAPISAGFTQSLIGRLRLCRPASPPAPRPNALPKSLKNSNVQRVPLVIDSYEVTSVCLPQPASSRAAQNCSTCAGAADRIAFVAGQAVWAGLACYVPLVESGA